MKDESRDFWLSPLGQSIMKQLKLAKKAEEKDNSDKLPESMLWQISAKDVDWGYFSEMFPEDEF